VLERASARETAARVAVGAVCRALLRELGVSVCSVVTRIGEAAWEPPAEWSDELVAAAAESDVGCPAEPHAHRMREAIDRAGSAGDTLGGVFEVRALGVPPGVGSHVSWDRRLDARLAAALMGIPAIKGVEFGLGFGAAQRPGSAVHDPIGVGEGPFPFTRASNHAGGVEGGISNGEPIVVRAAMKPIPTLTRPLPSVSLDTLEAVEAHSERSDVCAVPAAAVVGEAVVCLEIAGCMLEKFGGDRISDTQAAVRAYLDARQRLWEGNDGC